MLPPPFFLADLFRCHLRFPLCRGSVFLLWHTSQVGSWPRLQNSSGSALSFPVSCRRRCWWCWPWGHPGTDGFS